MFNATAEVEVSTGCRSLLVLCPAGVGYLAMSVWPISTDWIVAFAGGLYGNLASFGILESLYES